MLCEQRYEEIYHKKAEYRAFCPYRVSPLGAHIDHQMGKINGLAIDQGTSSFLRLFAYAYRCLGK